VEGQGRRPMSWRDVIKVHPAAELFPMMSEAELRELGEDIKKSGLKNRIVFWGSRPGEEAFLLDGRNRLDAMEMVGLATTNLNRTTIYGSEGADPYPYVISANMHRRHLTAEDKCDIIAKLLRAKPEVSNATVAKQIKADDKTVAKVRRELEATSEIP